MLSLLALLHTEGAHKFHAVAITHAEIAPPGCLNVAHVSASVAIGIGGDAGKRLAGRHKNQAAYRHIEGMVRRGPDQSDVRGGSIYNDGPASWRQAGSLLYAAGYRSCGEQC